MGLTDKTTADLISQMAPTRKGLSASARDGGFFYFVSDPKGQDGALIVQSAARDSDGKKTARAGRALLKVFKKDGVRPRYSQGKILSGKPLVFEIDAGSARPATLSAAFKKSSLLHDGVGAALAGALKGAKIRMAGQEDSGDAAAAADTAGLDAWKAANPLVADMSPEEAAELFAAEKAFSGYADKLPHPIEEEQAIQERLARTEEALDTLAAGAERLEALRDSDPQAALAVETEMNAVRVELAQLNANGTDPFESGELSGPDKALLDAAVFAGMKLLQARIGRAHERIRRLERKREGGKGPKVAAQWAKLTAELEAVRRDFSKMRA